MIKRTMGPSSTPMKPLSALPTDVISVMLTLSDIPEYLSLTRCSRHLFEKFGRFVTVFRHFMRHRLLQERRFLMARPLTEFSLILHKLHGDQIVQRLRSLFEELILIGVSGVRPRPQAVRAFIDVLAPSKNLYFAGGSIARIIYRLFDNHDGRDSSWSQGDVDVYYINRKVMDEGAHALFRQAARPSCHPALGIGSPSPFSTYVVDGKTLQFIPLGDGVGNDFPLILSAFDVSVCGVGWSGASFFLDQFHITPAAAFAMLTSVAMISNEHQTDLAWQWRSSEPSVPCGRLPLSSAQVKPRVRKYTQRGFRFVIEPMIIKSVSVSQYGILSAPRNDEAFFDCNRERVVSMTLATGNDFAEMYGEEAVDYEPAYERSKYIARNASCLRYTMKVFRKTDDEIDQHIDDTVARIGLVRRCIETRFGSDEAQVDAITLFETISCNGLGVATAASTMDLFGVKRVQELPEVLRTSIDQSHLRVVADTFSGKRWSSLRSRNQSSPIYASSTVYREARTWIATNPVEDLSLGLLQLCLLDLYASYSSLFPLAEQLMQEN